MSNILLPKVYEIYPTTPEKFHKYAGMPKISYSQYTSWKDPLYHEGYIKQYFMGEKDPGNIYAHFGSACGGYLEDLTIDKEWLSAKDVEVLKKIERPDGAIYEGEIVIDRGDYVIQGFIDQEFMNANGKLTIKDLKTGNVKTKIDFYGGDEYQQTTMYAHARKQEGWDLEYVGVMLLGRKGFGDERQHNLHLSGDLVTIETPYSEERAENFLKGMDKVVKEISNLYKTYVKINK